MTLGEKQVVPQNGLHRVSLGLVREAVGFPRFGRIVITLFLTLAVTFSTVPLLAALFRMVGFFTQNIDIVMAYTFATERGALNVLVFVSLLVGVVYYMIGWRVFIGMAGATPAVRMRVFWFIAIGLAATVLTGLWLLRGVTVGSGTV